MSSVTIGTKTIQGTIVKIRPGQELEAMSTAKSDGQDNTFFKVGNDAYVVSGLATHIHGLKDGTEVTFNGQKGTVLHSNNEQDAKSEFIFGAAATSFFSLTSIGGALAMGGGSGLVMGCFAMLGVLGLGGSYTWHVFNNRRRADADSMARHGSTV